MPEEAFGGGHRAVMFKMEKERREEFMENIKYQVPEEVKENVEVEWKRFKEAVLRTAEEVCGRTSDGRFSSYPAFLF
ncbi:hypothetical protein J437_LFUL014456 [Ladona fulva]|uniref:Uncharacterized protein n=1 Tax=Ladona fulva TaxID=123851 RepID=A0A8K0KFM7_LADFU|nr:hypothetical protein J437_LFUL014456 [Ladona fulva]